MPAHLYSESLDERFRRLVLNRQPSTISAEHIQRIARQLARKNLHELHEHLSYLVHGLGPQFCAYPD